MRVLELWQLNEMVQEFSEWTRSGPVGAVERAVLSSPAGQPGYYGGIVGITLPTGGQDTFTYTIFKDARGNKNLWLNSRISASGTWTFTPSLVTLVSICGSLFTQCQQVQATKPNGDTIVTDYRVDWINSNANGGAFPVLTNYYSGAVSSANLVGTVSDTWDFSQPCPLVSCNGSAYIRKIQEQVTVPVPGGTSVTKQTKWTYDSPMQGNITGVQEWSYRPGTAPTFPTTPDRATYTTYFTTGTNNINRPLTITSCNNSGSSAACTGGGSMVAQRNITYDSYGSGGLQPATGMSNHDDAGYGTGFTARGNPTQIKDWVAGGTYLTTSFSYDTTGNVVQLTDPKGNVTTYSYADNFYNDTGGIPSSYTPAKPTNAYVTGLTPPIIGTGTYGYYYGSGKQALFTDPNRTTTYSHFVDPFDRPTGRTFPIGWSLLTYPSATEADGYFGVGDLQPSTGCSSCQHTQVVFDAWGRQSTKKLMNNPSGIVETDTNYDVNGRVLGTSHPYSPPSTPVYETSSYDGLDRTLTTQHPDSNYVQTVLGANVTTKGGAASQLCAPTTYGYGYPSLFLDEVGKKRQIWSDGFGRTIETDEPDSSGNLTVGTCYTYNALNYLASVLQGAEGRTYSYDGLGRLTQEVTPEAGTVSVSYTNSGGGLCSGDPANACAKTAGAQNQTNPAVSITTTYCYDALNRLTSKGYGSTVQSCPMSSPAVTYSYDQGGAAAFALGRITSMTDPSGSETYTYDSGGRVIQLQKTVGTTTYVLGYQYNVANQLTQITYPSNRTIQQGYDAVGNLLTVASGSTNHLLVPATNGYNAAGQPLTYTYGNGVIANFSYSANRSQLGTLSYTKGSQTLFALNYLYSYDQTNCATGTTYDNGQINCITDNVDSGRTANYTYDPLRRLSTAATKGSVNYAMWGLSEGYDRYGNRLTQTVTAGSGPGASLSFPANNNRPSGYTYDASGNLIVEPLSPPNNYSYDAENRMISFSGSAGNATYAFDDNNHRVKKALQTGTTTVYIFSGEKVVAEYDNGAAPGSPSREYIYSGGGPNTSLGPQLLAKIESGATQYYHQDHLSVRLMTDSNGNTIGQQGHFPFGESWYQSNTTAKWMFTSYELDKDAGNNSGLNYALARFYNSRVASFCSADPIEGWAEDPQSWNRYAYVENDPINMADPHGKSLLGWLIDILIVILQIFAPGNPTIGGLGDAGVGIPVIIPPPPPFVFSEGQNGQQTSPPTQGTEGQSAQKTSQPPTPPPGDTLCPKVNAEATVISPKQAHGQGAISHQKPQSGDVAIRPRDFGVDYPGTAAGNEAAQKAMKQANIRIYPDWSTATDADTGANTGAPPGAPKGPYKATDVISPAKVRNDPNRSVSIDIYRSQKSSDTNVDIWVIMKPSAQVSCPQ